MNLDDYASQDGVGLADLIRRREVSQKDVLEATTEAIARVDPILNFTAELYQDRIENPLADLPEGPLAGVPTLLKDFLKYEKGRKSECGCLLFEGNVGSYDSEVVLRFRAGGMPIIGRSAVPEFGWASSCDTAINGITRNPWDLRAWPGGSSSGAAVAVASGALAIAHTSDGGGSTRVPAAYQGLVGMKPTRGRVSDGPGVADPNAGMSCHLAVTRTVRDTAAVLDVLSGPAIGDPHLAPVPERPFREEPGLPVRSMRVALLLTPPDNAPVAPEILAATRDAARLLEDIGHRVEEVAPPFDGEAMLMAIHTVWTAGMANTIDALARQLGRSPSLQNLTRTTYNTWLDGTRVSASDYINALGVMNVIRRQLGAFFTGYDLVLSPTTTQLAQLQENQDQEADFDGLGWTRYMFSPDLFNTVYNITGNPAISLPLYQTEAGAQIGIQFVGRFAEDGMLLRLAAALEQALPWAGRRAPVHVLNDLSEFDRARRGLKG